MTDGRPIGDLSPAERLAWAERDPEGYGRAVRVWARQVAEEDFTLAMRKQTRRDLRKLTAPLRWIAARLKRRPLKS